METLLQESQIVITERDKSHPGDFMNGIEKVLDDLKRDGVMQEYTCSTTDPLPDKRPLTVWLKRVWEFEPPPKLLEQYNRTGAKRKKILDAKAKDKAAAEKKALEGRAKKALEKSQG